MAETVVLVAGADPLEHLGGHASYVRAHARAVARAGFDPHLFCVSRHAGLVAAQFGVVHRTRSPWRQRLSRSALGFRHHLIWLHAPLLAASIQRFVLARGAPPVRLIHGFGVWGCAGVLAARRLARQGVEAAPIVSAYTTLEHEVRAKLGGLNRAHGSLRRVRAAADVLAIRWVVARYERQAYTGSRFVMVNYESVRRLLLAAWGTGVRIRRMPYASEAAFLREDGSRPSAAPEAIPALGPPDAPLVVAVSRQDPRKGVDVLLRALARLRTRGVRFRACLVGGGMLLGAHRTLAGELGLGAETTLTGFVPDPYAYLQHADIFVLPSLQEASGSVSLLEALQAGAAVVASGVDGIPEDVADGESAILVEPGDAGSLAAALERVLTDSALRGRLGRRARETFEARFSAEAFAEALGRAYGELGVSP